MLREGTLKPGDKIPSERELAQKFSTTRGYIRKALQKLEFYGLLEIIPKKGVFVSQIRTIAIDALITNIHNFESFSLEELIETRSQLEVFATRLAAERIEAENLERLWQMQEKFCTACRSGHPALEEDHLFHLALAAASQNRVLQALLTMLTPEIIAMNRDFREQKESQGKESMQEHALILQAVSNRDPAAAVEAMDNHMNQSRRRRLGK